MPLSKPYRGLCAIWGTPKSKGLGLTPSQIQRKLVRSENENLFSLTFLKTNVDHVASLSVLALARFLVLKSRNLFGIALSPPNREPERGAAAKPETGNSKGHKNEGINTIRPICSELEAKV